MRRIRQWLAAALLATGISACATAPEPETGLAGQVRRGPITPVCRDDVPCEAPFAANFIVFRGSRIVATFRSDSAGGFEVRLVPGDYEVAPGADAPIPNPELQRRAVDVTATGITHVDLQFDTYIR